MQRYGTIVVVGGGCYGSYYVRQLGRATAAGALHAARVVVVDRDPTCRVAREPAPESLTLSVDVGEWSAWFADYLGGAADAATEDSVTAPDAIVPSPLMPHLLYEWLARRARDRWPDRDVSTKAIGERPPMPWQYAAPDGVQYVSFAEWTCPVNCIEPAKCPVTRGPRDWSMPPAVEAYVQAERGRGRPIAGPVIFHCRHRAYGVGMIDTAAVIGGDRMVAAAGAGGAADVLVGTVSHCHGALALLAIGA